jgi:diguanylate cyclase
MVRRDWVRCEGPPVRRPQLQAEVPTPAAAYVIIGAVVGFVGGWLTFRRRFQEDHLTGLLNLRAIKPVLRRQLRRAARRGSPLCVALLDLDQFKAVNTQFGYRVGDCLLKEFAAQVLQKCQSGGVDLLRYRFGDEFLLVMNGMDLDSARQWLANLSRIVASTRYQIDGYDHRLSFAAGLASARYNERAALNDEIESLLRECEQVVASCKNGNAG